MCKQKDKANIPSKELRWRVYGNSLHNSCNFSLSLKWFQNKKFQWLKYFQSNYSRALITSRISESLKKMKNTALSGINLSYTDGENVNKWQLFWRAILKCTSLNSMVVLLGIYSPKICVQDHQDIRMRILAKTLFGRIKNRGNSINRGILKCCQQPKRMN